MAVRKVGHDRETYRRVTCRRCGSVLEYLPVDIRESRYSDYDGTPECDYYVVCPECGSRVIVKQK